MSGVKDYGVAAHQAARVHLEACFEAMYAEEDGEDNVSSPASAPFCGCEDCIIREVLHVAVPVVRSAGSGL